MGKVKDVDDHSLRFICPGCKEMHVVNIAHDHRPAWSFNGDYNNPTITPSILVRSGHYVPNTHPNECWCNFKERFPDEGDPPFKCSVCHSFVTDGRIQFLGDCTHELAGQTVDLSEIDI